MRIGWFWGIKSLFDPVVTKTIDNMSITYDITTDVRFKQGLEKGLERGLEEGLEKGLEEGKVINSIIAIRNMVKEQIITESKTIALILATSVEFVENIKNQLKKEEKILQALSVKGTRISTVAKKFAVSKVFVKVMRKILKEQKNRLSKNQK